MAGNNQQQEMNLVDLLIMLSESLFGVMLGTLNTVEAIAALALEKKEREKKNDGKGDWVLRGEKFEKEMHALGEILQENIKHHAGEKEKPEEDMTPEERAAHDLRSQMLEEIGELMNLDPKKGIRTKQQFEKYQQIKEYFLKDNLAMQKKNAKDLQEQKKELLKNAEKEGLDNKELERLQEEYEKDVERLAKLTEEKEKDIQDRKNREQKAQENPEADRELQDENEFRLINDEDEREKEEEKKEEEIEKPREEEDEDEDEDEKEEEKKEDDFGAMFQGMVKGAGNAAVLGALKRDQPSPYAMDKETMQQQQAVLKNLLDENIRLRTGLGDVIMNVGGDNMNPEQQMHAKNVQEARKFIDMDPAKGISDKEAYDSFMDVKNYFLEQNISHVKASMNDNLGRQEAIRSSMQKENEQQRQEDRDDRQKRENDPLAKPEVRKNERELQHEARKNDRRQDQQRADEVKRPELRRGPNVNPPGIRKEPTSYRELEREIAEEDRLKNSRGRANTMDRVREQLRKKKEVKKPKLPEEDLLKDPVLNGNGIRRPKI